MAETTPEQDLFKLSLNPIQDYFSIDIRQINGNGLEVERFCEKNGILEHMDATHKIDTLKHFIQCLRRLYQQSITCSQLSPFQITCLRNQLSVSDKSKRTNDIHSLANIYCSVLTNEKWQNYSEELPIEDIQCSNPDLGLDILRVMTEGNDSTTNTKEVFLHPFYWSDAKKVDFLCNATIYISSKIPAVRRGYGMDMVLKQFNMYEVEYVVPEFGWIECLRLTIDEQKANKIENDVISKLARKFKNNTVYELLRFFRIHSVHRHNDENDVKAVFGDYPAGYLGFFTSRFPKFFMHVYWNMKIYLEGDTKLERYFMDDLTTLDKSFNSEAEGGLDLLSRNQRWTPIAEGIKYDQESCYREGYKVFDAIRESAGVEEKIVVKFVPVNTANKREIDCLWAIIGHENVVKYLQSGYCKFKNEKSIFITMEKCDKDTLFEKIQAENWSYDVRKTTVRCIAKGLQHLKEKGILHRDLKPQNILFRGDVPVISDFGVSRRISRDTSHTYQSVMHVGTGVGWRAPETSMEGGWCSFAGDVYAAGLVNFFALTNGKHPFGEDLFGRQYLINNYPDNRYKTKGMERNLEALEKIGVLDCTIAHDMIDLMLSPNPKHRPTVEAVLENPFFWTVEKRLKFFSDTHKCVTLIHNIPLQSEISKFFFELNKRERKYERQVQNEMENLEENWKDKLPFTDDEMQIIQTNFTQQKFRVEVYKDAMVRKAKKYGDSVTELLRFIRNRYTHINEDKKEGTINQSEEQFFKYFSDRFPHFFLHIYSKITDNNPSQSEITIFSELNRREGKYGSQIQDEMKNWKEKLPFTDDEMRMIQANFAQQSVRAVVDINAVTRKAKKYKDSVTELLRFIRNRYMHINDDKKEGTINQSEDQILKYYFDRFPHLFVYVYCKIKDNYYGKSKRENCCTDILAEYFPLLQPNIIRNEVNNDSLEIEWEPVICANHYKLEIYTNNSDQKQPVFKNIVGKKAEWTKAFDDKFGYGTSYYAVVTAIGEGNKRSSTCTDIKQTGIRKSIYGKWFEKVPIIHAPGQVELIEDGDAQEFVESVQVKWKELETKPEGYRLILYNGRNEQIATETVTEFTHHVFEKLAKPGSLWYCTVAAYNTAGEGKPAKSQNYRLSETPSCQSKSVVIRYKKHDSTSNVEISEIENLIKSNSEVDMIEFCDCKIGDDYCTPGENQTNTAKCKISKLIISYTDHFKEFSGFFYSTFGGCKIKSLCLVYANLDDQDVDNLQSFMVKGIESLDISYNREITADRFEQIGNMIADQGTLKAIDCDLGEMKFAKLCEGLKNVNLRELDVGYNDNLAEGGFEMLAKLVASRGIKILKLRGCQLTEKIIQVFYNKLEEADEKVMLNELNVSYNPEINPAGCEILGLIIKKFGITTLNLAGCKISEEHLTSLMNKKDIELHAINLNDNSYPGNIIIEIANIVGEFQIQELDISDCMLSASELRNFRTKLNGKKLQKLHLGDKNCEFGMEYIKEVCQLLPTVTEMLYLQFLRVDHSCHRLLKKQNKLSVN